MNTYSIRLHSFMQENKYFFLWSKLKNMLFMDYRSKLKIPLKCKEYRTLILKTMCYGQSGSVLSPCLQTIWRWPTKHFTTGIKGKRLLCWTYKLYDHVLHVFRWIKIFWSLPLLKTCHVFLVRVAGTDLLCSSDRNHRRAKRRWPSRRPQKPTDRRKPPDPGGGGGYANLPRMPSHLTLWTNPLNTADRKRPRSTSPRRPASLLPNPKRRHVKWPNERHGDVSAPAPHHSSLHTDIWSHGNLV